MYDAQERPVYVTALQADEVFIQRNKRNKQTKFVDKSIAVCMKKKQKERRIKQIDVQENYESEIEENSNHDSDDSYDQAFGIKVNHVKIKQPKTEVSINGQKYKLLVNTGRSINLLNETVVDKMKIKPKDFKT